jgi:ketosteroid isomerase-like protein
VDIGCVEPDENGRRFQPPGNRASPPPRLKPERTPRVNKVRFDFEDVTPDERHALTALCTEYVWRIDNGYAAAVPALFTADGSMELPWGTPRGAADLKAAWEERARRAIRTRHMISHLRFSRLGADEIAGEVSLTLYHADAEGPAPATPAVVGEHIDVYRRGDDGRWRIHSRRFSPAFSSYAAIPVPERKPADAAV